MQILISCAKTMTGTAAVAAPRTTRPLFEAEAAGLALRLAALPAGELERMLRVNPRIAAENRRRYLAFHDAPQLPAIAAYTGVVFRHIAPAEFSPADFAYAQEHLSITSFLYGLLRPLDAIRPYRLEGSVAPPGEEAPNLFEWWRDRLTGPRRRPDENRRRLCENVPRGDDTPYPPASHRGPGGAENVRMGRIPVRPGTQPRRRAALHAAIGHRV